MTMIYKKKMLFKEMSSRPLLTKEEIVSMYMDEWYRSHHDNQGTRRPASEIEQKRKELLQKAQQQIERQEAKTSPCLLL